MDMECLWLATMPQINEDLLRNKYDVVDHLSLAQCAGFAGSSFTEVQHIWRDLSRSNGLEHLVMHAELLWRPSVRHATNLTLNALSNGSSFYPSGYSANHRLPLVTKPNTSNLSSNDGRFVSCDSLCRKRANKDRHFALALVHFRWQFSMYSPCFLHLKIKFTDLCNSPQPSRAIATLNQDLGPNPQLM